MDTEKLVLLTALLSSTAVPGLFKTPVHQSASEAQEILADILVGAEHSYLDANYAAAEPDSDAGNAAASAQLNSLS